MVNKIYTGVLAGFLVGVMFIPAGCTKKVDTASAPVEETKTVPPPKTAPPERVEEKDVIAEVKPKAPPPAQPMEGLSDIYFDFDQSTLRDEAKSVLDENAKLIQEGKASRVVLEGHADERGTSEYNLALGEKRAQAVKRYLEAKGIHSGTLRVVSYGEERGICSEADESCYQKNRRVSFGLE
jgi:peptidoglycan-associated lipoprotein